MADNEDERDDERDDADDEGDEAGSDEGETEGTDEDGDEGSDDASASSSSDDGSSDEEEDEEPASAASSPAAASTAAATATAAAAKGRLSAGARLAAAKAAKAAKKAVKKATLAEERAASSRTPSPNAEEETPDEAVDRQLHESPVGQAALSARDWAGQNQTLLMGIVGAAAVGLVGWLGWSSYQTSEAEAAGALLREAVEISQAEIVAEDDTETTDDEEAERTYTSISARNEEALAAYRRVLSEYPSSGAAAWARLGEARILLDDGEQEDAREAFEAAAAEHGSDTLLAMRAYEGIGFTYEAEENWDEARETFERIRGLEDGGYAAVADYHLARINLATGEEVAAQESLEGLVDSINAGAESAEPEFPYVLAQAQTLLRELDPSSESGTEDPDIMEMIRRAMESRGAGGGE